MLRWVGRTALVTGAYTGIGGGISKALIEKGMNVVGCGRNVEKLNEFAKTFNGPGEFVPVKCDVTKEVDILAMFDVANKKFGGIDVCINNAGVGFPATLLEGKVADWKSMVDTKTVAICTITREAAKSMLAKGIDDGHVINIGSIFGQYVPKGRPSSHMNAVSQIAMKALTEGTKNEFGALGKNFRVTELSPGYVITEFETRMRGEAAAEEGMQGFRVMQPEDMADCVLFVLGAPPHIQVSTLVVETTDPWP